MSLECLPLQKTNEQHVVCNYMNAESLQKMQQDRFLCFVVVCNESMHLSPSLLGTLHAFCWLQEEPQCTSLFLALIAA